LILAPNSTGTLRSSDDVNPLLRGLRKRSESSNRSSRTENAARRTQRGRSRSSSDTAVFENSQNLARFGSSVRKGGKPYEGRHSAKAEKPIGSRATLRSASVAIAPVAADKRMRGRRPRSCENIRGNGGTARARRVRPLERIKPTGAWAEFAA
jgi:hypothetical protein